MKKIKYQLKYGFWYNYGGDGRSCTEKTLEEEKIQIWSKDQIEGLGWKARIKKLADGDYGWGPLSPSKQEAISAFKKEREEMLREQMEE
jgi:hypothetical protein